MPGTEKPPYVDVATAKGRQYIYYRRDGRRLALRGPFGSREFWADYRRVHAEAERLSEDLGRHTIAAAIAEYRASATFVNLKPASQRLYELYLGEVGKRAGAILIRDVTADWVDGLRDMLADDPLRWNKTRSLMRMTWASYGRRHPEAYDADPWEGSKRLGIEKSTQNRAWPDDVLVAVLRDATPAFRALITCLLLSAQRISDVCAWPEEAYDADHRLLRFRQMKTGEDMAVPVPGIMAEALRAMRGRVPGRLLATPRGKAWTKLNAEETLLSMRARLKLPRYTIHGLRGTSAAALVMLGFSLEQVVRVTGHTDIRGLRPYLQGVEKAKLAKPLLAALDEHFAASVFSQLEGANTRSYSGIVGVAAAKAGVIGENRRRKSVTGSDKETAKPVPNAKLVSDKAA